jgi:DNA-binding transcriptional MocR family regulator
MHSESEMAQTYLYEDVALKISDLIQDGSLKPGERVPSIRGLRSKLRVSLNTVLQAYMLLDSKGLIEARPQSGFYVKAPSALPKEPSISRPSLAVTNVGVTDLVAKIFDAARAEDILQLVANTPNPEVIPVRRLTRIVTSIAREFPMKSVNYDFPPGNEGLRRQIAKRSLDWGGALPADEIVTTNGAMEALNLCLRAVASPGDTIAIESPTFFGVLQAIESLKLKALEIPTHPRDGISIEALEEALRRTRVTACLFTPNFNNPLGSCMSDASKKRLVMLLAAKNIPLIEDDIYGDLCFGSVRPRAAKAFDKRGMVLVCSSFSKTLAPGYRVGWVAAGRFHNQVKSLKLTNSMASTSLTQMAIANFLETGGYDRHLRKIRKIYASQVEHMRSAIARHFPKGTKVTNPQGGFYVWVELPKHVSALALHRKALSAQISIAPGPIFSPKQKYENFVRLSCGLTWSPRVEDALITLGKLARP